jgi:hypothetical protein
MGAIMIELMTLRPLFPGSSEIDQVYKICSILGAPTKESMTLQQHKATLAHATGDQIMGGGPWNAGLKLGNDMGFKFPIMSPVPFQKMMPHAPDSALKLVASMLFYDPELRPTAMESLQNEWFADLWDGPLGRIAFTPTDSGQALQILGDKKSGAAPMDLEREPIQFEMGGVVINNDPPPKSAVSTSSFELHDGGSEEAIGTGFYSGVASSSLPPLPYSTPNFLNNRGPSPEKKKPVNIYESFSNPYKALPSISGNVPKTDHHSKNINQLQKANHLVEYQDKQWEDHQQFVKQQHEVQHHMNQAKHTFILESNAAFSNPFQKRLPAQNAEPTFFKDPVLNINSINNLASNPNYPSNFNSTSNFNPGYNSNYNGSQSPTKKKELPMLNKIPSPKKKPMFGFFKNGNGKISGDLSIEGTFFCVIN